MTSKVKIKTGRQTVLLLLAMVAALVLSSGVALAVTKQCQAQVQCIGTPEPDTLNGTAGKDIMFGRGAADILKGFGERDVLYGEAGSDGLFGGPGQDLLNGGPGKDELNGGGAYDKYRFHTNSWGQDSIADSTSLGSELSFAFEGGGVTEDLTIELFAGAGPEVKYASGTSTINWESTTLIKDVFSGEGDDNITGNLLDNKINGWQGADTIFSGPGNDTINAVDGEEDDVNCGSNPIGGPDHDTVYYDDPGDAISPNCEVKVPSTP